MRNKYSTLSRKYCQQRRLLTAIAFSIKTCLSVVTLKTLDECLWFRNFGQQQTCV